MQCGDFLQAVKKLSDFGLIFLDFINWDSMISKVGYIHVYHMCHQNAFQFVEGSPMGSHHEENVMGKKGAKTN